MFFLGPLSNILLSFDMYVDRPEVMDPGLLRPGRFGNLLYVPLPSPEERGMILRALATKMKIDASVDLMAIGKDSSCKNFSGADLFKLVCVFSDTFSFIHCSVAE